MYANGAYDTITGQYQFGRRYYNPSDGRWTSQDPLGFKAGDSNLYRYSFNQSTDFADPSGEIIPILVIGIIGISTYLAGASIYKYSRWSMENQSSRWALSMTYARWGMAGGQILMSTGLAIAAAPVAAGIAAWSSVLGYGMMGVGVAGTAWGGYNIYQQGRVNNWGMPEYVGAYGSLAAPWVVGAGWYAGYKGGYLPGPLGGYRLPGGAPTNAGRGLPDPSTPVGRSGNPLGSVNPNQPTTIGGRPFSGHAIDQMQARGIPPSVVENTIQNGRPFAGNTPGTTGYFDPVNNVVVITNSTTGNVITVRPGPP